MQVVGVLWATVKASYFILSVMGDFELGWGVT